MSKHGNSLENNKPHHLYQIEDLEEKQVFKYGISDNSIDEDGLSNRVRNQVKLFNRIVGWVRFIGKVLIKNIDGREKAREVEDQYIKRFRDKY